MSNGIYEKRWIEEAMGTMAWEKEEREFKVWILVGLARNKGGFKPK